MKLLIITLQLNFSSLLLSYNKGQVTRYRLDSSLQLSLAERKRIMGMSNLASAIKPTCCLTLAVLLCPSCHGLKDDPGPTYHCQHSVASYTPLIHSKLREKEIKNNHTGSVTARELSLHTSILSTITFIAQAGLFQIHPKTSFSCFVEPQR